jgi:putative lipoic acid-binding regulatory protein
MNTPTPTTTGKDVIYVDIDDEITAIIDKVRSSHQKIVALVLPKRASVMQSIVNMKLLKRTADEAKKHIVLITTEVGLLPLAASVGMHVAKSLQSRPEIPTVAGIEPPSANDEEDEMTSSSFEPKLDARRPVGEYAAAAASPLAVNAKDTEDEDTIELDDAPAPDKTAASASAKLPAPKKDKKLRIPDFNKFRLWIALGVLGVVVLGVGLYFALAVMPKATLTVKTDSSAIQTNTDVTFRTGSSALDLEDAIVPAILQQVPKTQTQQAEATGSVNKGERASGEITITNCNFSNLTLPAGTGFSADGMTFISSKSVTVPKSSYDFTGSGFRCMNDGKQDVPVVAQKGGAAYNLTARDYTVANAPENVKAQGSAMAGGTDNLVKVVQQSDIDAAKQKISAQDAATIKTELKTALQAKNLYALEGTFAPAPNPEQTVSVAVGAESDVVAVTQKTTYTMLGTNQEDLKKIIAQEVHQKIDKDKQSILDYGLGDATFRLQNQQGASNLVAMSVTSIAGSDLDLNEIKKQIAGKKASDAKETIGAYPGVTEVSVKYSPFWVSSIPKKTSKITVIVEKPEPKNVSTQ